MHSYCRDCVDLGTEVCPRPTPTEHVKEVALAATASAIARLAHLTPLGGVIPPQELSGLAEAVTQPVHIRRGTTALVIDSCIATHQAAVGVSPEV